VDAAKILPLAFVMIAGPQIISAFFFATADSWQKTSAAYVFGAALSITAVISVAYFVAKGATSSGEESDSGPTAADYVVIGLLLFAAIRTYLKRGESEAPKWMGRLQSAAPKTALVLGFLLLGFFPSDLVTSVSVGSYIGSHGDAWWRVLPFVGFTLILLGLPALCVAAMGRRAQEFLPKARDWMSDNSWVVSEVVIVFFIAIILAG
jgi:hypothetical protein